MDYNPNTPATLGPEWLPHTEGQHTLDSNVKAFGTVLEQTTVDTIDRYSLYVKSLPTRGGLYVVEAFNEQSAGITNLQSALARPNEDVGIGGWQVFGGGVTNLWSHIDEATLNPNDAIELPANNTFPTSYIGRFNTASFVSLTGKRILAVGLYVHALVAGGSYMQAGLRVNGLDFFGMSAHGLAGPKTFSFEWKYNPATKRPWTIADVVDFDTGDAWIIAGITQNIWTAIHVYQVWLRVVYCDENRLAYGVLDDSSSGAVVGLNEVSFLTPLGGNWTKGGSGQRTFTVRRYSSQGAIVVPYVQAETAPANGLGLDVTLDPTYGYATALAAKPWLHSVRLRRTDGAYSVDSQPYAFAPAAQVFVGQDAEQEFPGTVDDYGVVRFLARPQSLVDSALGNPEPLVVKIRRRSDNVQLGSSYSLSDEDLALHTPAANGWTLVQIQLPTPATLTAVQHYVEFSSLASGVADGAPGAGWWEVVYLTGTAASAANAGYGGTTERGTVAGLEDDWRDVAVTVSTVPDALTGFDATAMVEALADESVCCADGVDFVRVAWDAVALGAAFSHYEVQRQEDPDARPDGMALDGVGDNVSTPDAAAWTPSGLFEGVVRVKAPDYNSGVFQTVIGQWGNPGDFGWRILIHDTGSLFSLRISADGTTSGSVNVNSGNAGFVGGTGYFLGWSYNTATGAWALYIHADQDDEPGRWAGWTPLNSGTAAAVVPFNTTTPLRIAASGTGASLELTGTVYAASLYDDGAQIASPDFTGPSPFLDAQGNVWTPNGNAALVGGESLEASWATVARVHAEEVNAWDDWEGLRGVPVWYRARVVRNDLAVSLWSPGLAATKPIVDRAVQFVSNYSAAARAVYDRDPEVSYEDHDAAAMTHHAIYGRNRQRAYQPAEVLGDTWRATLIVGIDDRTPAGGGKALDAFEPLKALAKADVPYLAVLDHDGTRLYASLRVPDKSYRNPLGQYLAPVLATEVQDEPFAVDVA